METDIDSRVFVTADGYVVSVPDGYAGTSAAQTIQCFIPSTGGDDAAEDGEDSGVLVPGSSSVTCSEIGSGTNLFAYNEETDGFELPAPVVDWSYSGIADYSFPDAAGDFAPFSYSVAGYWNPGELKITAFQGAPQLSTAGSFMGMPSFQNGRLFQAFVIPNADGTGYDLLYGNHDAGTVTRTPYTAALTAQVELGGASATGASIGMWTLAWVDVDGQPSDGPNKMTAAALTSYVARADHDGVEIPDDACARIAVTGLLTGYGVKVASSEGVDSFTLVPSGQMPEGSAIVSRFAPLKSTEDGNWLSQQKVIIYESTPEVNRLTNQEWNALKEAGYIAVHNSFASVTVLSLVTGTAAGIEMVSATEDLHHVFQTFRRSGDPDLIKRAAAFWKNLKINPDYFTVAWDRKIHLSQHAAITLEWKNFILNNTDANGNRLKTLNGTSIKMREIKRNAIDLMFKQCDTFKIPIHDVQPYDRAAVKGMSLNKLTRLDSFDRRYWNAARKSTIMSRWGKIVTNVKSVQSATMIKKGILGNLGLLIASVYLSSGDIAGAASVAMDIPKDTAQLLLDSDIDNFNWGMPPPQSGWKRYIFSDGTEIHLGDEFILYKIDARTRVVEEIIEGEVCNLALKPGLPYNTVDVSVIFESDIQFLEDGSWIDWLGMNYWSSVMHTKMRRIEVFRANTYPGIMLDIGDVAPHNALGVEYIWR